MVRRAARKDDNQNDLVDDLIRIGAGVADTSQLGDGFPDLVVVYKCVNYLVEVKDPAKPPSKRKLTPKEQDFFDMWEGPIFIVETLEHFLDQIKHHEKRVV